MEDADNRKQKPKSKKVRVEFKRNRAKPARDKDWTRKSRETDDNELDTHASERVVAKGSLSRKRTVSLHANSIKATRPGTIVTMFGKVMNVDDGDRLWPCTARRVLRTRSITDRNALTVGDRVRFTIPDERVGVEMEGVIESVEPRKSELKRIVNRREHAVAANVDQVVIVTSARLPKPKPHLVDRYIVSALFGRMTPVICLNKIDLVESNHIQRFLNVYEQLGYPTFITCAVSGTGIEPLREQLAGRTTVIAGQSGVGKSSLLNAIQPGLQLKVGTVVEDTAKGRHTTTRSSLLKLDFGGYVVDTPGVKSFDVSCVPREQLEEFFVEFVDRVAGCKFHDCTHIHEIDCAIRNAVDSGHIDPDRYESYARLFTDTESR